MGIFSIFSRKNKFDPAARRAHLLGSGRITEGRNYRQRDSPKTGTRSCFYLYTLNGVDFESSELLSEEQKTRSHQVRSGSKGRDSV
jgi:hypothetical protein